LRECWPRPRAGGKLAGVVTHSPEEAARMVEVGFNFVALSHVVGFLAEGGESLFNEVKGLLGRW